MTPKIKILIVDDEEMIRTLIQRTLLQAGYDTLTAANGHEALEKLSQPQDPRPALILLDIRMPGLNGLELLEIIRGRFDIPVIMVSGQSDVYTMSGALNLGADDFLKKPFRTAELVARVKAKLRRVS